MICNSPGSTSSTISIASFQNGTIAFRPVRLKSSSMKSSATSQKYSCPGKEQNQLIHVRVEVGVDEPIENEWIEITLVISCHYATGKGMEQAAGVVARKGLYAL